MNKNDSSTSLPSNKDKETKQNAQEQAIALAKQHELFHDTNGEPHITIYTGNRHITYAIESKNFQSWLQKTYIDEYGKPLSSHTLKEVIDSTASLAKFSGREYPVYHRVATHNDIIYIDMGNKAYECIVISKNEWQIINNPSVKFVRTDTMKALPSPIPSSGNFGLLWNNVNIPKDEQILVVTWLINCFQPDIAFPPLVLIGPQGTAKSTTQEILKQLVDPNASNLRSAPRKSEDFMIAAANNYLLSFNNLSKLTSPQQDDLCCISTGGGYATRKLYSTNDETVINIKRPVVMNSIVDIVTAQDLLERSIIVHLPMIEQSSRKTDKSLKSRFEYDYPIIFTGLLDIMASVLKYLDQVNLEILPRMADFAVLGHAVEKALNLEAGSFNEAFKNNHAKNEAISIENYPVITKLIEFMHAQKKWDGNYQALLNALYRSYFGEANWPRSPKHLASMIKRHESYLRKNGVMIDYHNRSGDGYILSITNENL